MPCKRALGRAVCLASLAMLSVAPVHAQGDSPADACNAAYEANQKLRMEGKLTAARAQLEVCVQQACPALMRPDCVRWLSEVDAQMPSIVLAVKDPSGRDTVEVTLYVDDQKVSDRADGRPIPLDPGPHRLRFEHAGQPPIERQIVIQQGVKNRIIEASFAPAAPPGPDPITPQPVPPADEGRGQSVQSVMAYVFLGLSVPAWVMFAVFGLQGKNRADELQLSCGDGAPEEDRPCPTAEVDKVEKKLLMADVSLGVGAGLTALGVGFLVWHFVRDPEAEAQTDVSFAAGPTPGGAIGQLTVRF